MKDAVKSTSKGAGVGVGLSFAFLKWGLVGVGVGLIAFVILDLFVVRGCHIKRTVAGVPVRVRCASWVNFFTRADATVIAGLIHVKRGKHTAGLRWLASEVAHVYQWIRDGIFGFVRKFVANAGAVEHEAHGPLADKFEHHHDLKLLQRDIESRYDGTLRRAA